MYPAFSRLWTMRNVVDFGSSISFEISCSVRLLRVALKLSKIAIIL